MKARARKNTKKPGGIARWIVGILALGLLIAAVVHFGDFARVVDMARHAQPLWLLVALALQASTYVSVALGWRSVLRCAGTPQPFGRLIRVALAKLFADQVIPSAGMGGNLLLVDRLTALGTSRGTAVATLLLSVIGYYAAYAMLALLMLFTLWLDNKASPAILGLVTLLLLVALAVPGLALWLRRRGRHRLPGWVERIGPLRSFLETVGEAPGKLVSNRGLILSVTVFNALVFLADAATLAACLCAVGQPLVPATAFVALMAASIATTLGPIPMGLGSFEATCTATLGLLGIHVEPALAATLLLRTMTFWLPLFPGLLVIRRPKRNR